MSLEQELARNTEAMIALTAAITHSFPIVLTNKVVNFVVDDPESPFAGIVTVAPPKPVASHAAPVAKPAKVEVVTVSPSEPKSVEYADVAAAIVATFKTDRARVVQVLANFGAAKGPQLKLYCMHGVDDNACGIAGATCAACPPGQRCQNHACVPLPDGGH